MRPCLFFAHLVPAFAAQHIVIGGNSGTGTGIGEIGLNIRPSDNLPLFIDVGIQGYAGKREGVTGSMQFRFEF